MSPSESARKDQKLLLRWDALLVLDFSFGGCGGVTGLNLEGDGPASQGLTKICISVSVGGPLCRLIEKKELPSLFI